MNKVFKVIWNHATQTWTAVSELGHAKGKTKSKKIVKLTALAGAVMGVVGTAQATVDTGASTITISSANPNNVVGTGEGQGNINIGTGAHTFRSENGKVSHDAIAMGTRATGTGDASVAIGLEASATKQNGIAIGHKATGTAQNAITIGEEAKSTSDLATAIGTQAEASGGESIALGSKSKSSHDATVAVGKEANASQSSAIAVGYQSAAAANNAVAVGKNTTAGAENAIAVGLRATATGTRAIATGAGSKATGEQSLAVGFKADAKADNSIAQGNSAVANKESDIAIGTNSVANGSEGVCNKGEKGSSSLPDSSASNCEGSAVALGKNANATGTYAVAVGVQAQAGKKNTTALGSGASVATENAVALGSGSVVTEDEKYVPTNNATVGTYKYEGFAGSDSLLGKGAVVSVGDKNYERQIKNVAAGQINSDSTDAINGSQLFAVANRVENLSPFTFQGHNGSGSSPATGTYKYDPKSNANNILKLIAGAGLKLTSNGTNEYTLSVEGAGSTGSTGPAGAKGDTGPAGPKGDTGPAGPKGDTGEKGDKGGSITGEVVNNGDGTHTITITDLESGSVTTTIVKDGKNGKDGKDGATGAKGDTGPAGPKGDTGATGATGEKGDKGDSITGEVVNNGDGTHTITITDLGTGSVTTTIVKDGKNGKDGKDGAAGAKGDKGDKGDKGEDGVMTWDIKSTGNKAEGSADTAKTIKHTNTVDMAAGKNLTVNQTNNSDGAKVEFALNSTVTNLDKVVVNGKDGVDGKDGVTITAPGGKDGNDGLDGKVGISGKDGKDAVSISGKDGVGQIGLTGPKGKDGKDGTSLNITTDRGAQTLVNKEVEADGKAQRIIYVPTDKDGNPLRDSAGKEIKREVATMDDGLTFVGNEGSHDAALGTKVNVKGATTNTEWNKFDAGKNIMTKVDGDTLTVGLAKDLEVDNVNVTTNVTAGNVTATGTISAPTIKAGDTTITNGKVANLKHHIENPTTVVDNKVLNVSEDEKKEAATVRDVLNSGWNLQANSEAVDAVTHGNTVNFASDDTVEIKPTTDGNTSTLNLSVNATNVVKQVTGNVSANTTTGKAVVGKDGVEDTAPNAGNKVATVGDVANTINNTGWITKAKDDTGAEKDVTVNPGDRVEYVDGQGTKANVTVKTENGQDVVNVTYDVKTDGTTVTVNNDGNLTVVTGNITKASDDVTNPDAGKVTVNTGEDNKVATVKNVADAINSAGWIVNTGKAADQNAFKTEAGTATKVGAGDKVNFQAGKNLEVKREGQNIIYATSEDLDAKTITVTTVKVGNDGKDGKPGVDGSIGVTGKDGAAVAINGKDGSIGLTGPKGADGKDGASVTIKPEKGTTTVAERDGGKDINRVTYTDKDKDGNDIKREIATLDDGLKFTGDDGQTVNRTLGSNLNVKGGAADSTTAKNIRVTKAADGEGLDVNLANNIKLDNDGSLNIGDTTVKNGDIKIGDTHITNGAVTNLTHHIENPTTVVDDNVLDITDDKKKDAATVRDVLNSGWNLQANGKPVDAVTHGNNVNFASDKGTVTVTANSDGKTSVVNLDVNVDNDTISVNEKGQLVASGATNFNVATKDGGNKLAKKGGSSTTKITAGKTITYTAGKNIAIEQNGGDILVSTTEDVDHNSVTTNNLTVKEGGNVTVGPNSTVNMGGNQVHNVKAGTADTDAVNVSQLRSNVTNLNNRINKVGKEARGGIAGANAAAGLPQVYIPGKSMVAASAGTFKGESAVAVGYSRSSDNGKVIFKLQGNANTQGDVGGSVGVGYQW